SSTPIKTLATVVMIFELPGDPRTRNVLPSCTTIVGVIDERGRLPGAMALAAPWINPSEFGTPGLAEKSSISSFNRNPRPCAVTREPNQSLIVVVTATAFPSASTTE